MPELAPSDVFHAWHPRWRILRVFPGTELGSAAELRRRAVASYVPTFIETRAAGRGRFCDKLRPLIPGYAFVAISDLRSALAVPTVMDFLRCGDRPAELPQAAIDTLEAEVGLLEAARQVAIARAQRRGHSFKVGDIIRLPKLANITAEISALDGKARIRVLLRMFGGETAAVVDAHEIEAV